MSNPTTVYGSHHTHTKEQTIMQTVFHIYNDPGHGWCKVPRKTLRLLGIADQITSHSYQKGQYVYLEEDKDLHTFYKAWQHDIWFRDVTPTFIEHHANNRSRIRNYQPYSPE